MIYKVFEICDSIVEEDPEVTEFKVTHLFVRIVFTKEFDKYVDVLPYLLQAANRIRFRNCEITMLRKSCPKVIKGYIENGEFIPADKAFKGWIKYFRKSRKWVFDQKGKNK